MKKLLFRFLSKIDPKTVDDYIKKRWVKPLQLKDLNFAFVDDNNQAWYEFPDGLGNPITRISANLQAYEYLTARMSPEMLDAAEIDMNKALAHGDIVGAGAIFKNLKSIRESVIPVDVLINLIATDLVREDEDPKEHNQQIHKEKCNYLKTVIERGDGFFFRLTAVIDLSERFKISKDAWQTLLSGFQEAVKKAKEDNSTILSMTSEKE